MRATTVRRSSQQDESFRHFLDWAAFNGIDMPADAIDVANYLLELLHDGADLPMIRRHAAAIHVTYIERQTFLDPRPIEAAIAIAENQLSPNRVLH
jgi:hypothetical protein